MPKSTIIQIVAGEIEVPASVLGKAFGLEAAIIPDLMREGKITSLCEKGEGDDVGRLRLSFFYAGQRLRLIVNGNGQILQQNSVDYGDKPLPAAMRRPGN
jgi:hypothetical protein